MRSRLFAGILAFCALAGAAACGHVRATGNRPGHATPTGRALSQSCKGSGVLSRLGVKAAAHEATVIWAHFKITETARSFHFTESGAGLGFARNMIAGRARLAGLPRGWPRSMRLVLLDGRFYVNAPGMAKVNAGKSWVAFSAASVNAPRMASMRDLLERAGFLGDPRRRTSIENLLGCSSRVSAARNDTLGGQAMTRYAGLLPLGPATAGDPTLTRLQAQGARSVAWELWVDKSGAAHRLVLAANTSAYGRVTMDERFSGWAKPVRITAPPPAETMTLPHAGTQPPAAASAL